MKSTTLRLLAAAVSAILVAAACSTSGNDATTDAEAPRKVVLVTHESFALPKDLVARWEKASGYTLVQRASGDAGVLTNKLVLTKGNPTGDVAFGVDNTYASRALDADVFAQANVRLPDGVSPFELPGSDGRLVPIDNANVCVNVDTTWFSQRKVPPPATFEDLTKPAYRGLFVTPGAPTSSPGMAFMLATISAYGGGWKDYWAKLMANGTKITSGWSDAYQVDFTAGGGKGQRPIVVSYDSSPAFTVSKDGERSSTKALLDTCFRQVEYAGILAGAKNPDGARSLVEFMLSPEVQAALPESMYVFPVRAGVELPPTWERFAVQPSAPAALAPAEITAERDTWLREWTDVTSR